MTRAAHLSAKDPYLIEARKEMTTDDFALSVELANAIKGDDYPLAEVIVAKIKTGRVNVSNYIKACQVYDKIPQPIHASVTGPNDPPLEPVVSVDPNPTESKNQEARIISLQAKIDTLIALNKKLEEREQKLDAEWTKLNGELIAAKEKCDKWEEIANDKSQDAHFVRDESLWLREKVEKLTKERDELAAACTKQESDLVVAREELKDYPIQSAKASKARYFEGVAKTYGALLKYLGMNIINNYDPEQYQECVVGKDATANRLMRDIVEKSPKYKEQEGRINKILKDKNLLSTLIDTHMDEQSSDKLFKSYFERGGE